jgi:phage repressor protein C with HTH and peptisase S24 domain
VSERAKDADGGRLSTQAKLAQLAPGFGHRVDTAVATFDNVEAAAVAIGLGHNQLRRIIQEQAVPSFPAISLLARKSGYRLEWIAFNEPPEKSSTPVESRSLPSPALLDRFVWVPEYDVRAAAGHGAMNEEPEIRAVFPVPQSMIEAAGVDADKLRILRATGASMEPDIMDGDSMVIVIGEEHLRDGKIYVLNIGDDTLVKQLQLETDGGMTLLSKNPSFAPRKVGKSERSRLSIAGRVLFALKRFA